MKLPYYLRRFVFGGFFPYNGINHLIRRKAMAQYVDAKNVPMPDAAVTASGVALALGGASLIFGIRPVLGAASRGWLSCRCISCHARFLAGSRSGKAAK
jgi:uncharacterized membrane protein